VRTARPTAIREQTSDPEQAIENVIARDILFARHIRNEAARLNLKMLEVDWTLTLDETVKRVEQHFDPLRDS
jgi:hypothetical protein